MHCRSFPPIASPGSWVLILGTMPGKVSLREQQYYAHPQNLFWRITAEILGFDATSAYPLRVSSLKDHGVALWDVLQSCTRESSLDADIVAHTIVPNDFGRFSRPVLTSDGCVLTVRRQQHCMPDMSNRSYKTLPQSSMCSFLHKSGECCYSASR